MLASSRYWEGLMSLPKNHQEDLFSAIDELPDFLPEDDPMMVFSREIYPIFKDEDFAYCYSNKGRNAISPAFLACVTLLQFRENLSDPETAEAVIRRLDWKIALHLRLRENVSFDSSTLCYYRRRLKENEKMSLIFDKIVGLAQEKGFIQRRTKHRIDATHIIAHVNRISTTDLLFRAVRCLVEEIEEKDPEYYEKEIAEDIKERYSKRFSSFGLSKEKRGDKQAEIVEDGLYIKSLLEKRPCKDFHEMKQLKIMGTIFEENVVISEKKVEEKVFIEVKENTKSKQTIFDPKDTSIKLGIKGNMKWEGSKCHIVETAEKGKINFVTDMIYQRAHESDINIHDKVKEGNKRHGLHPEKVFTDGNYISATYLHEYRKNGQELMGYIKRDSTKKHEDFRLDKFKIDTEKREAICPAGKMSVKSSVMKNGYTTIFFNRDDCRSCSCSKLCIGENSRERRKRIRVRPYYECLDERRKQQETEEFKEEMSVRAQIEGTISEATRFHGLRYTRYKGEQGNQLQFYLTGAALNVRRLIKALIHGRDLLRHANT